MTLEALGPDPLEILVGQALRPLSEGEPPSRIEVADLTGLSKVSAGKLLTALADAGHLEGSRPERIGRGFFYVPANSGEDQRNVTGTR